MSLFHKIESAEDALIKKNYELAKQRIMDLHTSSSCLMYIDEAIHDESGNRVLIGELAKGSLKKEAVMGIYSCEGIYLGDMIVDAWQEHEERGFLTPKKSMKLWCYPLEDRTDYVGGQLLACKKETNDGANYK